MDRQIKSKASPAEIQSRWGIPDWTQAKNYPDKMTDLEWRWEFLRRRADYRDLWDQWKASGRARPDKFTVEVANLKFGVSEIYDPRCHMSDDLPGTATAYSPDFTVELTCKPAKPIF